MDYGHQFRTGEVRKGSRVGHVCLLVLQFDQRCTDFPKIYEIPHNSRSKLGDMKQVP
jgi:hypothetical protein